MSSSSSSSRSTRSSSTIDLSCSQVMANAELEMKLVQTQALKLRKEAAIASKKAKKFQDLSSVVEPAFVPVLTVIPEVVEMVTEPIDLTGGAESIEVPEVKEMDWDQILSTLSNITVRTGEYANTLEMKRSRSLDLLLEQYPALIQTVMSRRQAVTMIKLFSNDVYKVETVISSIISSSFFPIIYLEQAERVVRSFPSESKFNLAPADQARCRVWELLFLNKKVDVDGQYKLALCMIASGCGSIRYAQYIINMNLWQGTKASQSPRVILCEAQVLEVYNAKMQVLIDSYVFKSGETIIGQELVFSSPASALTITRKPKQPAVQIISVAIPFSSSPSTSCCAASCSSSCSTYSSPVKAVKVVKRKRSSEDSGRKLTAKLSPQERKESHIKAQRKYMNKQKILKSSTKCVMAQIVAEKPRQTPEQMKALADLQQMRAEMASLSNKIKNIHDSLLSQ